MITGHYICRSRLFKRMVFKTVRGLLNCMRITEDPERPGVNWFDQLNEEFVKERNPKREPEVLPLP